MRDGQKERYPVVSLVLYFGYERRWSYSPKLRMRLRIPDAFKGYVSDYRINVFEIAYLTDEQLNMFESDFQIIADYFVQMRRNGDYHPKVRKIRHVRETLHMLSVLTGDNRFEEAYNAEQGGVKNMCEVLDRIEKRGREQGIKQGIKRGREQGLKKGRELGLKQGTKEMILRMYRKGYSVAQIADVAEMSEKVIKRMVE